MTDQATTAEHRLVADGHRQAAADYGRIRTVYDRQRPHSRRRATRPSREASA